MSLELLVPIGSFLAIALAVWAGLSAVAEKQSRASDRLERLMQGVKARQGGTGPSRRQTKIQEMVARAAPALSKPLKPKDDAQLGKLKLKLLNAGYRGENAVQVFLAIKFACLLVALAVAVPSIYARYGTGMMGIQFMVVVGALGFYLPGIVLGMRKRKRQGSIFVGLPDALDLMVVCVEAGLGLDVAMRKVAAELADASPALCEEISIANFQVQMGRPRREVLRDLGVRTGVDDMRSIAAVLIQAERFGASIATALRVQSDSMRVKRRQYAEEKAAKTAVLLLLPLILFIFPGIFVVLVGPAGIQIATTLMK